MLSNLGYSEHTNALSILDSLLQGYDRRATPTNHKGEDEDSISCLHGISLLKQYDMVLLDVTCSPALSYVRSLGSGIRGMT